MFQIIAKAKRQRRIYTPELYRKRYKFRVLIKLDQAEELEHITDWSDIWHNFDVVYRCRIRRVKERNCEGKKIEERELQDSDHRTRTKRLLRGQVGPRPFA